MLQTRRALKLICKSEFVCDLKNTNYFTDSDSHLLNFSRENSPLKRTTVSIGSVTPLSEPMPTLPKIENDIHLIALKNKFCSACKFANVHAIDDAEPTVHQHRLLLTEYCNLGGLTKALSDMYRISHKAERWLQMYTKTDSWNNSS